MKNIFKLMVLFALLFCGSSNQRLIDVPASLKAQDIVLYDPTFFGNGQN